MKTKQVYSGETSYTAYVVEIQEINLMFGRVLPDKQPPCPPVKLEEEKEESFPQANPPAFPERLIHPSQHTQEEIEILGELRNMCVKILVLKAIRNVPIYNELIKQKCFKHPWRRKKDTPTINFIG